MNSHTKARLLATQDVDIVIEIAFDAAVQTMSPETFVRDVLHTALDVRHLFAGGDFAFGKGRQEQWNSCKNWVRHWALP